MDVVVADSTELRERVYSFRYEIYVQEMKRPQQYADHERRRIEDPLDGRGIVLAALDPKSRAVIGTVRTNFLRLGSLPLYSSLYGLDGLANHDAERTSVTTRLMVAAALRNSPVAVRLATMLYAVGLRNGIACDYIDCNAPLLRFFEKMGYVFLRMIEHPEYGEVCLMRLSLTDTSHLRSVRSPFLKSLCSRA